MGDGALMLSTVNSCSLQCGHASELLVLTLLQQHCAQTNTPQGSSKGLPTNAEHRGQYVAVESSMTEQPVRVLMNGVVLCFAFE